MAVNIIQPDGGSDPQGPAGWGRVPTVGGDLTTAIPPTPTTPAPVQTDQGTDAVTQQAQVAVELPLVPAMVVNRLDPTGALLIFLNKLLRVLGGYQFTPGDEAMILDAFNTQAGGSIEQIVAELADAFSTPVPPQDQSASVLSDAFSIPIPQQDQNISALADAFSREARRDADGSDFLFLSDPLPTGNHLTLWNDWNLSRDFTPNAGAGVPVRNTLVGNIVKDQFAVNDALQFMSAETLHDWKEGTDMSVHVHWADGGLNNATVRGVKWEIEYAVCNPVEGGFGATAYTATVTGSSELTIPANEPDRTHHVSHILTIPGTSLRIGAHIIARVKRIASVTNVAPVNDPFLISFGIHYEADTRGSRSMFTK